MKFTLTVTDASTADIVGLMQAINGMQTSEPTARVSTGHPAMQPAPMPAPIQPSNPAPAMPMPAGDGADENGPPVTSATHDNTGLPWDERIHSGNKAQNTDGSWRKRRGVADATYEAIAQEIRAKMTGAPMPAMQPAPVQMQQPYQPPAPMPVMQPVQMPVAMPMQPPAPVQQPYQPPAQPAPVMQPGALDFHGFMTTLSAVMSQGRIDQPYLATITAEISGAFQVPLNVITDIANYPQMVPYAVQILQRDGRWQ